MSAAYAELCCRSHFSFLEGASSPEELVKRAVEVGLSALAITDRDGLYGAVAAHTAAKGVGLDLILGVQLSVEGVPPLTVLVENQEGYGRLCRWITSMRSGRGERLGSGPGLSDIEREGEGTRLFPGGKVLRPLPMASVLEENSGLLLLYPTVLRDEAAALCRLKEAWGDRLYLSLARHGQGGDLRRSQRALQLQREQQLPLVAIGDVYYHDRSRRPLQDTVTCIREGVTLASAGRLLFPNDERFLRGPEAMARRFSDVPDAVARTVEVAGRCTFSLEQLRYCAAREWIPEGMTSMGYLRQLVEQGSLLRYRGAPPQAVRRQLQKELALIESLDFPGYFLTVWDIVRFARGRGILCQGRGSAANSAVCYVLGITAIDPVRMNLLFERFLSVQRGSPPDIDVDFEHERREEVIQYIYRKYGRDHAAMVAEVICHRRRSALRDTGRVFGLSEAQISELSAGTFRVSDAPGKAAPGAALGGSLQHRVMAVAAGLEGAPRHLSVHVGGFVISEQSLLDLVPQEDASMAGRTVVAWDKNDIEALGMLKVDVLGLGMLTALRKCFDLLALHKGLELTLASVPSEDPNVYEQLCRADTVGLFQIESRAQMNMLPRLQPRTFYDLVVEVAIVRPGPIQGEMVHPYLRRRRGEEPIDYPHPALREVLGRTYGVPLFQEQAMRMAMAVAGFSPTEADALRRAMGGWRKGGAMSPILDKLRCGLRKSGVDEGYIERIVKQIAGFGEYGFPESHAASFALLAYASAWLRYHHPAAYTCALLNSQPMGFYAPHTLVDDAQRHRVPIRPVHIQRSGWDCDLEAVDGARPLPRPPGLGRADGLLALRLGLRLVAGLGETAGRAVEEARPQGGYTSIGDLARRAQLSRVALARLAAANAFACFGLSRRQALWQVQGLYDHHTPLFEGFDPSGTLPLFPSPTAAETMRADYVATGLSIDHHPTTLVRADLTRLRVVRARDLLAVQAPAKVRVGGLVTCRQHPDTRTGMIFLALEDETGLVNVSVPRKVYDRNRALLHRAVFLWVEGRLERDGRAQNVLAFSVGQPGRSSMPVRSRDFR